MTQSQIVAAYPLSPMQQGMLFHSVAAPGSDVYVEQLSCGLEGPLHPAAFEAAWTRVAAQHDVLRTAFAWADLPEPLQLVGRRIRLPLEVLEWRHLPAEARDGRLAALGTAERRQGFDLSHAPLWRLKLVRLSAQVHRLIWTWHHVILDAWSVPLVFEGVFAAYDALVAGREPDPCPVRPYGDFIAWQRAQAGPEREVFWRRRLAGFEAPTPLGVDGTTAAAPAGYGLDFIDVPPQEIAALEATARKARLTPATLVQGAWALLLSRYSGEDDVLFGTAVAGRPAEVPGILGMVGLMINTLPMRVRVEPGRKLGAWLEALQRDQTEARLHEQTPLSDIRSWSDMPGGGPLFESLLVFENLHFERGRLRGGGLALGAIHFVERADLPLTVTLTLRDGARLGAGYDTARFDPAAVVRMLQHLRTLLAAMTGDLERTLSELDITTPQERHDLIENRSRGPGPRLPRPGGPRGAITRDFEAVALLAPAAPAAVFAGPGGDVTLTYAALNRAANRYARHLRRHAIGPEDRVAIVLEASPERLVAILGVIKAGAAYVPLEPGLPVERLIDLIADCGARLVLAQDVLATGLSGTAAAQVLVPDDSWARDEGALEDPESADLPDGAGPDNLAYLIYTSGSTGRPKGVMATHAGLRHLVLAQIEAFRVDAPARVLQFASLGFDASISEIFTALLAGATLYMAPRAALLPSREFMALMARWRISTVTLPPSVLARLPAAALPDLTTLISAGEACPAELVALWAGGRRFINAYGPTEVTVCATLGEVGAETGKPTIGRPMGQARIYILDADLRPVPQLVAGHLHVGGPGVARGYWNRPDLTAAAFLPDPLSGVPGSRLYRTGDQARFLPDGRIEYLGRADDQIKMRGIRIEPGEIEAALRASGAIRAAAVLALGDTAETQRLVAFLVAAESGARAEAPGRPEWWPSIAEYFVYDELAYHAMSCDERRNASYRAAIAATVRGRVVLEVGPGPEALLARFCVEAGAARVYAVELLAETYAKARDRVAELGLADRIHVLRGDAATLALPEPAEICVSEIVGAIGGAEGAAAILDAVRPRLAPGALMIPRRSTTLFAPVELPEDLLGDMSFAALPARYVERIFAAVGAPFDLRLCVKGLDASHLLAEPRIFEDLDFSASIAKHVSEKADFTMHRAGRLAGFLVWLTLDTGAGPLIDILEHEHCWLPVFLPLFHPGLAVGQGDRIEATVGAGLCDDGLHRDYHVEGRLLRQAEAQLGFDIAAPHHVRAFKASPFTAAFFAEGPVPRSREARAPAGLEADLKARLRQSLPEALIPSRFVWLDSLPLLPSGKLDRRGLAAGIAAPKAGATTGAGTEPRSRPERLVATIWREILGLDAIDLSTNFFDQGGHSLALLTVQDRIRQATGFAVPVTDLFKYPTVATLAAHLAAHSGRPPPDPDPNPQPPGLGRAAARRRARGEMAERRRTRSLPMTDQP